MFAKIIDSVIGAFSPRTAVHRAHARRVLQRGYAAAEPSRLTASKNPKNQSADQELSGPFGANRMRAWARMLVRDNAWAWGVVDTYVNNVIGKGIFVQSAVETEAGGDEETINEKRDSVWSQWCEVCEINGQYTFAEIQQMAMREIVEAGEVLIRMITVPQKYKGIYRPVPFAIELIEADRLAEERDRLAGYTTKEGNEIVRGIELDIEGKPVAYWIYPTHPNDIRRISPTPVRIDASEIIHLFNRERVGQTRGITLFAPVVNWMRDLGLYVENEIQASAVASCFTVAIRSDSPTTGLLPPTTMAGETTDENGNRYDYLEPGMIMRLRTNESIESANPGRPNSGAEPWIRLMLRGIAVGTGLSYETVARDYSQTTYSSNRASQLEDRRRFRRWQRYLIDHFNKPIWNRFCMAAAQIDLPSFPSASELLTNPDLAAPSQHMPPSWEWVDPGVEQSSSEASIAAFQSTYAEELGSRGSNWRQVFYQRAKEQELLKKLKLVQDEAGEMAQPGAPQGMAMGDPAQQQAGPAAPEQSALDEVQDTALNGAQVASLVGVLEQVATGMLPQSSAKAVIAAAFPTLKPELIDEIVSPIQVIQQSGDDEDLKKKEQQPSDFEQSQRCTGQGSECNCKSCTDEVLRAFCATGEGGKIDNSCSPANKGKEMSEVTGKDAGTKAAEGGKDAARVLFEVAPNPDNKELTDRWEKLNPSDKVRIGNKVAGEVMRDVLDELGMPDVEITDQVGGFEDYSNQSFAAIVSSPEDFDKLGAIAKASGFALSQKSMMITSSEPFEGSTEGGFITIELPENADLDDIHGVYQALRGKLGDRVGGHTTVKGQMLIVDTGDDSEAFAKQVDDALGGAYNMRFAKGHYAWPESGEYDYANKTGPTGLVGKRGEVDSARLQAIQQKASDRLDTELRARENASGASDQPDGGRPVRSITGLSGRDDAGELRGVPSYAKNKSGPEDAISVVGVHYGKTEAAILDSTKYGTGLKGAESKRLQNVETNMRNRTFFYVDEGEGITPEVGVGRHRSMVKLDNIYDPKKDPTVWRRGGGDLNQSEAEVIKAGYDGYYVKQGMGNQGVVVIIGDHKVPVKHTPKETQRAFCATGEGGKIDNSCSPANKGEKMADVAGKSPASTQSAKPAHNKSELGKSTADGKLIDTMGVYHDPETNKWTEEREQLHKEISSKYLKGKTSVDQPVAILFGGGGGAGKSTIKNSGALGDVSNYVNIDADEMKGDLPEYREMLANKVQNAAAVAHEETSYLSKKVHNDAGTKKMNVILDGTGDSGMNSVMKKVKKMREHGAKVVAHYVTVDTETAVQRNRARYEKTGRYVPEEMLRRAHRNVSQIVPELIKNKVFDEFTLWDTNGKKSKRIAYLEKGELKITDKKAWDRFIAKAGE